MNKAIVTGITGQDGTYLAQLLLSKNHQVFSTYRRTASTNFWRIEELGISDHGRLTFVEFDLTDPNVSFRLINDIQPDEIYNLAAQSSANRENSVLSYKPLWNREAKCTLDDSKL